MRSGSYWPLCFRNRSGAWTDEVDHGHRIDPVWKGSCGCCGRGPDDAICPTSTRMVQPAGVDCGCGKRKEFGWRPGKSYCPCWTSADCWIGKKPFSTPHSSRRKRGLDSGQNASRERYEVHGGGRRPGRSCRSATCVRADCRMQACGEHGPVSEGSTRGTWTPSHPSAPSYCRSRL